MERTMTYDKLYSNMVRTFTVEHNHKDYKLGEYMLMKARVKNPTETAGSSLPAVSMRQSVTSSIVSIASFVNDKLTVKEPPIRDRTIRKFPFKTSLSALCSAVVVCALVISCALFGFQGTLAEDSTVNNKEDETFEKVENEAVYNGTYTYHEE